MYYDIINRRDEVIDLRSDTSTRPTEQMREAMYHAEIGDGGRVELNGRGEDPTVNELEHLAAQILGKDDAIFCPTGSLANHVALQTAASRGDRVLVEKNAHLYINERYDFQDKGAGLIPILYHLNNNYEIDIDEIKYLTKDGNIKAMCLENPHNYSSGTCLSPANVAAACGIARSHGIHVHLDGARIFNSAVAQGVDVKDLVRPVDSMMFCISKGLSAPVGSLVVGSKEFIAQARVTAKYLGIFMRQSGIVAAAGIVALQNNIERLAEDHENARVLGELIGSNKHVIYDPKARQTNMIYLDVTPTGLNAEQVRDQLIGRGLLVAKMTETEIRLVTHRNISRADVEKAARILNTYFDEFN